MNLAPSRHGDAHRDVPTPHEAPVSTAGADVRSDVVVSVRDLVKRYGEGTEAVRGLSFELHRGEVLGLLGPNGAGKTTTVEVLTGFRDRTSGDVDVLGLDPGRRDHLRQLRRRVGVVLQQTAHLRFLTARETLAMHCAYHQDSRDVDEVLAMVGLEEAAHKRVRELSGGQQRRLDVGVALVGRPELVFLDEPTTGFDPAARRRTWQLVRDLADQGTSVVLTTHYMEEASALADRVVVIGHGQVVGEGTPDQLARSLQLGTRVTATLPDGCDVSSLPPVVRAALTGPSQIDARVDDPAPLLAQLCSWAVSQDVQLDGLDVRAPSLEDSYLALTGADRVDDDPEAGS